MLLNEVAAVPAGAGQKTSFLNEAEKIPTVVGSPGMDRASDISDEEAFKKVYAHFFAGIIEKSLGGGLGEESQGLGEEYSARLYSKEIAEQLVSDIDLKNLMAARSFK